MALKTLRGIAASRKLLQGVLIDESKAKKRKDQFVREGGVIRLFITLVHKVL